MNDGKCVTDMLPAESQVFIVLEPYMCKLRFQWLSLAQQLRNLLDDRFPGAERSATPAATPNALSSAHVAGIDLEALKMMTLKELKDKARAKGVTEDAVDA